MCCGSTAGVVCAASRRQSRTPDTYAALLIVTKSCGCTGWSNSPASSGAPCNVKQHVGGCLCVGCATPTRHAWAQDLSNARSIQVARPPPAVPNPWYAAAATVPHGLVPATVQSSSTATHLYDLVCKHQKPRPQLCLVTALVGAHRCSNHLRLQPHLAPTPQPLDYLPQALPPFQLR